MLPNWIGEERRNSAYHVLHCHSWSRKLMEVRIGALFLCTSGLCCATSPLSSAPRHESTPSATPMMSLQLASGSQAFRYWWRELPTLDSSSTAEISWAIPLFILNSKTVLPVRKMGVSNLYRKSFLFTYTFIYVTCPFSRILKTFMPPLGTTA